MKAGRRHYFAGIELKSSVPVTATGTLLVNDEPRASVYLSQNTVSAFGRSGSVVVVNPGQDFTVRLTVTQPITIAPGDWFSVMLFEDSKGRAG